MKPSFVPMLLTALLLFPPGQRNAAGAEEAPADPALPPMPAPAVPAVPAVVRVTSSFDVRHAGAVLRQVSRLMHAGFLRRDAEQLAHEIDALPADQSRQWDFTVTYKRVDYPLQVRARLDDFGMLDLDFFCPPPVAGAVRSAVDGYLNSHGL